MFDGGKNLSDTAKTFQQKINQQLRRFSGQSSAISGAPGPQIPPIFGPLTVGLGNETSFFRPFPIDGSRWDKLYPYRLLVIDVSDGNKIVSSGSTVSDETTISEDRFNLSFQELGNKWELRLPITPQQLSISTPYALDVSATFRGIVEEHNGVKFKIINCAGTMGVWPYRPNISSPPSQPNVLTTLFAGTVEAFEGLTNQVNRVINSITSNHPANKPTVIRPEESAAGYQGTGYYHALMLDQFLEQYAEAKKNPANKHWRLVFDIPKQGRSFIVTPVLFEWNQSEVKPNEITYRFQLKAWRRIDLNEKLQISTASINPLSPDILRRIINTVEEARRTLGSAYNLIRAVRSDFQTPFNILREISLFAKDLAGLPAAVIDLPRQIIQDANSSIREVIKNKDDALNQLGSGTSNSYRSAIHMIKNSSFSREGLSVAAIAAGTIGISAAAALRTDPTVEIFENPEQNFDVFSQISVDEVNFNLSQQDAIDEEIERIRQISVDDLIRNRAAMLELALQIANSFGAGDDTYNQIYRRPNKIERLQEMNIDEFEILRKIYDVIQSIDLITSTDDLNSSRIESAYEYVGSLASNSGIPYDEATSKVRVPVPFGLTIEQIAARYLGNPDKWIEIAALNALKSPYIDENGFTRNLLSNADGRQFNINSSENLFIGQKIILTSLTQPATTRRIINIEKISPTNYLITVDGLANLDSYTLADQAKMKAYLPGTVNSSDQIFVPSELAASDTIFSRPVPATQGDPLVGLSQIDILLDDSGDIAMNSFGEIRIAAGMQNLIQALKLKFATPTGKLIKHPDYGAGLVPGISAADVRARDVYMIIKAAIEADSRFSSIQRLDIDIKGPTITVSMAVNLANGQGVFPISFVLNN